MPEQIKILDAKNVKVRILLFGILALAFMFAWFAVRWQLGHMLAELTPPTAPNAREIAAAAHRFAPADPITAWLKATVESQNQPPEKFAASIGLFEDMVRRAPNDFIWWLQLGRAYEQAERNEQAEKAFRYAIELAPAYTVPRWQAGNYYLRQGNSERGFAELRKAAETSAVYRQQVYGTAWDFFDGDKSILERLAGEKPDMRADLAKFYAAKELAQDSLRIWNTLADEDKLAHEDVARLIAQALYEKRFYRAAVEFVRQLGIEPRAEIEAIQNGSFESPFGDPATVYFGWKISKLAKVDVLPDPTKKKDGNRSLRVSFNGFAGREVKNILQLVPVQAGSRYRLSFWVRTENFKSAGPPTIEVVNANDDRIIGTSTGFPGGTTDWQPVTIDFAAPENAEAVMLRIDRVYCGEGCLISGTAWLDDFRLAKIN